MELDEGKQNFIESWGQLGVNWGVNKTMGQIHALLLISCKSLCCDQIMQQLSISRGNVNMNIRALIDWGLVHKEAVPGERKEYFKAEKDVFTMFKSVVEMRKRKELDPMIKVLTDLSAVQPDCSESEEFCRVVRDLSHFSKKAESALNNVSGAENNWLFGTFIKLMK